MPSHKNFKLYVGSKGSFTLRFFLIATVFFIPINKKVVAYSYATSQSCAKAEGVNSSIHSSIFHFLR